MYFEIESNRINTFVNKVENDGNSCNGLPSSEEIAPLNEAQVSSPPPLFAAASLRSFIGH